MGWYKTYERQSVIIKDPAEVGVPAERFWHVLIGPERVPEGGHIELRPVGNPNVLSISIYHPGRTHWICWWTSEVGEGLVDEIFGALDNGMRPGEFRESPASRREVPKRPRRKKLPLLGHARFMEDPWPERPQRRKKLAKVVATERPKPPPRRKKLAKVKTGSRRGFFR